MTNKVLTREPTNEEVAALSKALREGGGITTTAGVLTEAARMMLRAAPEAPEGGEGRTHPTGQPIQDAFIAGFLFAIGRQAWDDMHDYVALCAVDYAQGKPLPARQFEVAPAPAKGEGDVERADWKALSEAPRDGTEVEVLIVHSNALYSKDAWGEGWLEITTAKWIDHNGGGWTWRGLCGVVVAWRPLASAGLLYPAPSKETP